MNTFGTRQGSEGKSILRTQHGAAAVEFAIVLPFLVVLVFGIIEFGLLLYNQQVITNASREGARAAIRGDCDHRKINVAADYYENLVRNYCRYTDTSTGRTVRRLITFNTTNSDPSVSITPSLSDCTPGGSGLAMGADVAVTVQYTYSFLVPSVLGFGTTKLLTATTVMKMESNP